jgi:hypothetical protein
MGGDKAVVPDEGFKIGAQKSFIKEVAVQSDQDQIGEGELFWGFPILHGQGEKHRLSRFLLARATE